MSQIKKVKYNRPIRLANANHKIRGAGFLVLLTAVFSGLKLLGLISWSWFWALSPLIFLVSVLLFALLILLIAPLLCDEKDQDKPDEKDNHKEK